MVAKSHFSRRDAPVSSATLNHRLLAQSWRRSMSSWIEDLFEGMAHANPL